MDLLAKRLGTAGQEGREPLRQATGQSRGHARARCQRRSDRESSRPAGAAAGSAGTTTGNSVRLSTLPMKIFAINSYVLQSAFGATVCLFSRVGDETLGNARRGHHRRRDLRLGRSVQPGTRAPSDLRGRHRHAPQAAGAWCESPGYGSALAHDVSRHARLRSQGLGDGSDQRDRHRPVGHRRQDVRGPHRPASRRAFRPRVQAYATGFYRIRGQGEAERLGDERSGMSRQVFRQ